MLLKFFFNIDEKTSSEFSYCTRKENFSNIEKMFLAILENTKFTKIKQFKPKIKKNWFKISFYFGI